MFKNNKITYNLHDKEPLDIEALLSWYKKDRL